MLNSPGPEFSEEFEDTAETEREALEVDLLLEGIYRLYGYDFRNYMRTSIRRRIQNRMKLEKLPSITALLERALHDERVAQRLMKDFSINVTEMYRDPSFFRAFRTVVVPSLRELPAIRVWHAGCSTGEEVLSMAILLEEEGLLHKTRIFATDMNATVIEKARTRAYPLSRMQTYTKNYLQAGGSREFSAYYTTNDEHAFFASALMQNVTFFQHNLVTDRSFNEFHVILCRNVLIYFNVTLQNRAHELFHESLSVGGFLGLGSKESLTFVDCFGHYEVVDQVEKLYRKRKTQENSPLHI
ncbi:CheR family methyltransferase [Paenibacillus sedimenti]|uniref:Protein-glutamate O-methyltransferase CheR n=1 Tax=Paenibacillus sedimenti TaxID=2770274 RepID=A0A926KW09_9BACL|nr:protein-glutamate O-methyltransferase CheR [Paenibacillus sedimenti]MBD0383144.1 protein-glutamate O-methyltransferase CheR [Paenibacillus sedimenti]